MAPAIERRSSFSFVREAGIRRREVYYPWLVIVIAFISVAMSFGGRSAFAVFLIAVVEEFHWSRGLAAGALMVKSVVWTLSAPPA